MPPVSVLIPTKQPGPGIASVIEAILRQRDVGPIEIDIIDSGSSPHELALMRSFPVRLTDIPASQFGHGSTRNRLAREANGDILVFLVQDAEPVGDTWLSTLTAPLADPRVAGVCSRQIARPGDCPLVCHQQQHLYPPRSTRRSGGGRDRLLLGDMFFSNVGSAMRRDTWQRFPFREDVVMSEDQHWAADVLRAGLDVVYEAKAQVLHAHDYSLPELFRRNAQSGHSLHGLIADSGAGIAGSGLTYLVREALWLVRHGAWTWLPYLPLWEITRAAGFAWGWREAARQSAPTFATDPPPASDSADTPRS